jgi:hypothetical protein
MSTESELDQQRRDPDTRSWSLRLWVVGSITEGTVGSVTWVNQDRVGRSLTSVKIGGFTWNAPIAEIPHGLWCGRELLRAALVKYPPSTET